MIRYKASPSIGSLNNGLSRSRLYVVMLGFFVCYLIILIRLVSVALVHHEVEQGNQAISDEVHLYKRASIIDRNGILLAVNLTTASLYADPKVIIDVEEAIEKLHQLLPSISKQSLRQKLTSTARFVWIKRNLTPIEQQEINALGIPGLYFREAESRVYPHGRLFSHILGFTSVDGNGISGVERQFNRYLKGQDQEQNLELQQETEPLALSVDVRVQDVLYQSLLQAKDTFKAVAASGVVLDVSNGEILGMVSLPDFDPHNPSEANNNALFNRSTLGVYEMGSTFKTFNMALGLESGKVTMESAYDVTNPIRIARFAIRDYHPVKGKMTVPEIFINSSNIGSAHIVMEVGEEKQKQFLKSLGLLDAVNIELPEKTMPLYPSQWTKVSAMTISYGHGIAVSSVHLVQAIAAMVNGGFLYPATLLAEKKGDRKLAKQVITKATSNNIRKLMRYVVEHGTGGNADVEGYLVGGKTGSADKPKAGGYGRTAIISSFIGAFPMHQPKYVIFVMVDEPQRSAKFPFVTGGVVAAPVVGNIIEQIAPILGVLPVDATNEKIKKEFWYHDGSDKAELAHR